MEMAIKKAKQQAEAAMTRIGVSWAASDAISIQPRQRVSNTQAQHRLASITTSGFQTGRLVA